MKHTITFICIALIQGLFTNAYGYDWEPFKIRDVPIEDNCNPYDAKYESAPLMQVQAKTYFQKTAVSCSEKAVCKQRQKSYVVKDDYVFASAEKDGFRCVYYGTAKGEIIAGFLPAASLKQISEENKLTSEFLKGTWSDGYNWVKFTSGSKNVVHIHGEATYDSETPDGQAIHNEGSVSADAKINENVTYFREGGCTVQIRRRGPYLIIKDNSLCGGQNVRFWSIFTRKTDPKG